MARRSAKKKTAKKTAKKTPKSRPQKGIRVATSTPTRKATKVGAVPARYGTVTPHIIVSPCNEALAWYERALGAKTLSTMPGPGGLVMHGEMKLGDSIIMVSDEMPAMPGRPAWRKTPKHAGATTTGIHLYVKNVDALYQRAVAAGAVSALAPRDEFWGDRYAQVEDPYGHVWAFASKQKEMTQKQMHAAMQAMMAAHQAG